MVKDYVAKVAQNKLVRHVVGLDVFKKILHYHLCSEVYLFLLYLNFRCILKFNLFLIMKGFTQL